MHRSWWWTIALGTSLMAPILIQSVHSAAGASHDPNKPVASETHPSWLFSLPKATATAVAVAAAEAELVEAVVAWAVEVALALVEAVVARAVEAKVEVTEAVAASGRML